MSVPPQSTPSSSPQREGDVQDFSNYSFSQAKFESRLSPSITVARGTSLVPQGNRSMFRPTEHNQMDVDDDDGLNLLDDDTRFRPVNMMEDVGVTADVDPEGDEDQSITVPCHSDKLVKGSGSSSTLENKPMPLLFRLLIVLTSLASVVAIIDYKQSSVLIGYCDVGKNTNKVLETMKKEWDAVETCNRENMTFLYPPTAQGQVDTTECPPPSLFSLLRPSECTPCPDHGFCTQNTVACDSGYLLRPHPALFFLAPTPFTASTLRLSSSISLSDLIWKLVSATVDGLPGAGPVAFPPRCIEDPQRKKHIGVLGKAIDAFLSRERGRRMCAWDMDILDRQIKNEEGGEAKRWGVALETLKETMKKKTSVSRRVSILQAGSLFGATGTFVTNL
jgi:hypothetical protein